MGVWRQGQWGEVDVVITQGHWPVPTVTFDLPDDQHPAWQIVLPDARPQVRAKIGPFVRAQTSVLVTTVVDTRGCTATVYTPVTVAP